MSHIFQMLVFYLFFISFLSGQDYVVNLKNYGVEDGLSHRQVNCIAKDNLGFLWMGTPYGLNRFDGYEFKWWTNEKDGLPNNNIQNLVVDDTGDLWIIQSNVRFGSFTSRFISVLDTELEILMSIEEKLGKELPISKQDIGGAIVKDKENVLYFGCGNGARLLSYHSSKGLQVFPIDQFQTFIPVGVSTRQSIWGIADKVNLIEVSREGEVLQSFPQKTDLFWRNVVVIGNEVLFNKNHQNGTLSFNKIDENGHFSEIAENDFLISYDQLNNNLRYINFDPYKNKLWMTGDGSLPIVHIEDREYLNLFDEYPNLISDRGLGWRGVFFQPSGVTYLGGDFGLYQISIQKNKFSRYLYKKDWGKEVRAKFQNLSDNISCRGIYASESKIYINTERYGFNIIDVEQYYTNPSGSTKTIITDMGEEGLSETYALQEGSSKGLWIGQYGLQKFNLKTETIEDIFVRKPDKTLETIWAIYEDVLGVLWLGGSTGLSTFNPENRTTKVFDQYNEYQILENSDIVHIEGDSNGLVWICSNSGLYTLDIEKGITGRYWSGGKDEYYLPHDNYYHFYRDEQGIIWLGTSGGGLIRWDKTNKHFKQFTKEDGLSNNVIYAIYEDRHQNLWMSSDYGIIQFDKNSFQSKAYLVEDGITHNEFNRVSHFQTPGGRIYFGGLNGVTSFDPEDFYQTDTLLNIPLQITEYQQFDGASNQLLDKTPDFRKNHEIRLQPDDPFFRLGFSLLSFDAPEKVQYAYKIEGLDNDWTYQREPFIRMGRLPYGNHTLIIKGQAANGQWSPQVLSIPIESIRPFYLSPWFLMLLALGLLSFIAGLLKWRSWNHKKEQQILKDEVARQTATIRNQAEKLKELDAVKSRFYTNITHEFRTPLTVIMGIVENIKGYSHERQLIHRNSENLLRLVNELLDLSKLDSGTLKLNEVQGNIVDYLRYLTESFYSLAKDKKIQLTFYAEEPEVIMDFDEVKIQHIVYNLLSNALKFTPEGGKVILHIHKTEQDGNPILQLKVKDTGIGIHQDNLPFIFDRFYQSDGSATRRGEGTGIGLALTKELATFMQGTLEVTSTVDKGSEFILRLPIKQETETQFVQSKNLLVQSSEDDLAVLDGDLMTVPANESTEDIEKPLLLIIEDNRDVITYIESILKDYYNLETAENGQIGIDKAFETLPDIIITDVMMPEKDGYEVCTALKSDERTSHIPIVMLTAKAAAADRIEGLKTGADAYLMKPFNKEELLVRLEKLIELRKALQVKYAQFSYAPQSSSLLSSKAKKDADMNTVFLQKIRKEIDQHIDDAELGIIHLCRAVHLSHTQVFRKIKALTGEHPTGFIRKVRLHKAHELLKDQELNISEIAYAVGFTDPNYFSRAFSQEFGASPSAMRSSL